MFSFYGAKTKIIRYYPPPKFDRIIEPFAGAARYSLQYPEHDVTLIERDPCLARIWRWLIKDCTVQDLKQLPRLKVGDDLRTMKQLSEVERDFLGFATGWGRSAPGHTVTARADRSSLPKSDPQWRRNNTAALLINNTIKYLPKIKHWKTFEGCYTSYRYNPKSTWFIDPPYQGNAGRAYKYNEINYANLAKYCRGRSGQVIVCEGMEGTWLPFVPIANLTEMGNRGTLKEQVWIREEKK